MSETLSKKFSPPSPSPWLQFLGPIALAILAGYATVNYAAGSINQRLSTVEKQTADQSQENKRFITREEQQIFIDSTSRELREIHEDVRTIRNSVVKQ